MNLYERKVRLDDAIEVVNRRIPTTDVRNYYYCRWVHHAVLADMQHHYLAISADDPSRVSFADRLQHKYDDDKRKKTTLGRYLRKHLLPYLGLDDMSDSSLDTFVRLVKAELVTENNGFEIEIMAGGRLRQLYSDMPMPNNCMSGEDSCHLSMWVLNPDIVKCVHYQSNGTQARALLWCLPDNTTLLDRIYPNDGSHVEQLRRWAREHGYWYRSDNSLPSGSVEFIGPDGQYRSTFRVELKHDGTAPYADSFHYATDIDDTSISLTTCADRYETILSSTEGHLYDDTERCCNCGDRYNTSCIQTIDDDSYCRHCIESYFYWVSRIDEYVSQDACTECENCNEYDADDDMENLYDGGMICLNCVNGYHQLENGDYIGVNDDRVCEPIDFNYPCLTTDCVYCDDCNEWYRFEPESDNSLCRSCAANHETETVS